jgi:ribosomal protein S18 acetylase RimI-like enzyme
MIDAVREIRRQDIEATCGLLSHLSVSFGGVISGSLTRAICEDALRYEDPSILVAKLDGELAGVVIAIENRRRFWLEFASRHPLLALRVLWARARSRTGHDPRVERREPTPPPNLEDVAEVLFIGVAPGRRRSGVADRLYYELFERLRARRIRRLVCHIDRDNVPSLRLHQAAGFTLHAEDGVVVATQLLG